MLPFGARGVEEMLNVLQTILRKIVHDATTRRLTVNAVADRSGLHSRNSGNVRDAAPSPVIATNRLGAVSCFHIDLRRSC
jgi:hypothetical protein